jgi:hypothetical protein
METTTTQHLQNPPSPPTKNKKNWDISREKENLHFIIKKNCLQKHVKFKKREGTLEPLINFAPTCPDLCQPFEKNSN